MRLAAAGFSADDYWNPELGLSENSLDLDVIVFGQYVAFSVFELFDFVGHFLDVFILG